MIFRWFSTDLEKESKKITQDKIDAKGILSC